MAIAIINICSSVGVEILVVKLVVVVVPLLSSQRAAGTAALGLSYSSGGRVSSWHSAR